MIARHDGAGNARPKAYQPCDVHGMRTGGSEQGPIPAHLRPVAPARPPVLSTEEFLRRRMRRATVTLPIPGIDFEEREVHMLLRDEVRTELGAISSRTGKSVPQLMAERLAAAQEASRSLALVRKDLLSQVRIEEAKTRPRQDLIRGLTLQVERVTAAMAGLGGGA